MIEKNSGSPAVSLVFSLSPGERQTVAASIWDECVHQANSCKKCGLAATRNRVVFGEGDRRTKLMFIGEGPGADEDAQGRPFVGKAGQLLTQVLKAAGISRDEVYIANVVKCRPPENRLPLPEEMLACNTYLQTQITLINPAILVLLGGTPTKWLLKTTEGITKMRGNWYDWHGISVMPMFHPSYLLRYPDNRKPGSPKQLTWLDIREVKRKWDETRGSAGTSP